MGNIRRLKKTMGSPKIAMADARMAINGCQIFLGHPDPRKATASARGFRDLFALTLTRARCPNLHDLYNAHFQILKKIEKGEPYRIK